MTIINNGTRTHVCATKKVCDLLLEMSVENLTTLIEKRKDKIHVFMRHVDINFAHKLYDKIHDLMSLETLIYVFQHFFNEFGSFAEILTWFYLTAKKVTPEMENDARMAPNPDTPLVRAFHTPPRIQDKNCVRDIVFNVIMRADDNKLNQFRNDRDLYKGLYDFFVYECDVAQQEKLKEKWAKLDAPTLDGPDAPHSTGAMCGNPYML